MGDCGYCGAPNDRIDVSSFGSGVIRTVDGRCSARCEPPRCLTCDQSLDTDHKCPNIDCPLAFVIQFDPQECQ